MKLLQDLAAVLPRLADADLQKFCAFHEKYAPHFATISASLYEHLDAADQQRFVTWFLKRWAKIDLVNAVEAGLYQKKINAEKAAPRSTVALDGTDYLLRDFASQGCDFKLLGYDWFLGVHDIFYNQYEHNEVTLAPGDIVIDAGAFIGDTAVFYHHKLGGRCQIHSFELLDENIRLLQHNLATNGVKQGEAVINKLALSDTTGGEIVIAQGKTQGSTSMFGADSAGDKVTTITLDDYVVLGNLPRVDYIKMDIEGAEMAALAGARRTIQHFKPKLAICLYHKWDDAITIPKFLLSLGVDYTFSFKWVQLSDGWEAVLLAAPATAQSRERVARSAVATTSDPLAAALGTFTKAYQKKWQQADTLWRQKQQAGTTAGAPAPTALAAA